jgi:UDPglucose 6-dehydrogenase
MAYRIAVVGSGYVGLVTGLCFAETGNHVVCVDIDQQKVEQLNRGQLPIYEPGLGVLLERNLRNGRARFTTDLAEAVRFGTVVLLCLPTPPQEDGSADVQHVFAVAERIATLLQQDSVHEPRLIVTKSTVPPGTTQRLQALFAQRLPDRRVVVASNPEFLREGTAVEDFMKPERVIIGTRDAWAEHILRELYEPFVRSGNPIYVMDETSAELTKYAANAMLALRISFMNELSAYCEALGADIEKVRLGIGSDSRIGKRYLFAGLGYGGSCLPKDVRALVQSARSLGVHFRLIPAVEEVNHAQAERFVGRILKRLEPVHGRCVALWGVAFKPNTDDIREAPAFRVIDPLLHAGVCVRAYDPEALPNVQRRYGERLQYAASMYECLEGADALVIATEWNEFRNPDFELMRSRMRQPLIFDGRNLFSPEEMLERGFEYHSIGRPSAVPSGMA